MNVAPAPVMLAAILSPASAGAFAPGALASPVCAWLPDGWHAATNSSVDSASAVVRKMDVFMWAPWGGASRLLGSRSEEHTSELQSPMRISYAVFCLKKKKKKK